MRIAMSYCVASLLLFALGAQALTVDELVASNIQARGGLDKLLAIKTLKSEGKLIFGGQFELAYIQYQKAPDFSRIEATLQGLTLVQAWDGKEAWQIQPFEGRKTPERMSTDDAKALADDASISGPLADWHARGSKVEYLGTEDVDGDQAHKLKVTQKNGDVEYVYLDPDHFLAIRSVSARSVRGAMVETVTDYGDYEQVAGVYFPFSIASHAKGERRGQQLTIDKAEANVPVDDRIFAFPTAEGAAK